VSLKALQEYAYDGFAALEALIAASPYRSTEQIVASLTLFSHPETVRQTRLKPLFRVIRNAANHQLGINRRPPCLTVKRRQLTTQIAESDEAINRPQHMILRNVAFEGEAVEQSRLFDLPWSHHRLNPRRRTRIESVLMNRHKQSFSTIGR
jgi:hypothetical protein